MPWEHAKIVRLRKAEKIETIQRNAITWREQRAAKLARREARANRKIEAAKSTVMGLALLKAGYAP